MCKWVNRGMNKWIDVSKSISLKHKHKWQLQIFHIPRALGSLIGSESSIGLYMTKKMSIVHTKRHLIKTSWKLMFFPSISCLHLGENN